MRKYLADDGSYTYTAPMARSAPEPSFVEGRRQGVKLLPPERQAAWFGLLQAHAELTRVLDTELAARHGIGLSAYELMHKLANLEQGEYLRMTQIAEQSQLSLSRVSRIVDDLLKRGLVEKTACPGDSRAVNVTATDVGCELVCSAQETFLEVIEERFLGRLTCDEVQLLGAIFARLIERGPPA